MSEKVTTLFPSIEPVDPNVLLEQAKSLNLVGVVIIGRTDDKMIISTSYEHYSDILWELKQAERVVLRE